MLREMRPLTTTPTRLASLATLPTRGRVGPSSLPALIALRTNTDQTFEISNIEGWNNSSTATLRSIRPCSWAYCVNAVISRMFSVMP